MVCECAERLGGTVEHWLESPWAWTLYWYLDLQEQDKRRSWVERMNRIATAEMFAMAMHEPSRLSREREAAVADAGRRFVDDADVVADVRSAIEALERSGAMCDTPEEIEAHRARYRAN